MGSKSERNKELILNDIMRITNTHKPRQGRELETQTPTKWNIIQAANEGSNSKQWKKIADKLGIKSIDSVNDIKAIEDYVRGSSSIGGGGGGGDSSGAPRDSGEYQDILDAQEEDRAAGQAMAEKIAELEAQVGGISPEVQAQLDNLTLANTNLTNQLATSATQYQQQLDAAAAASAEAMQRMEMLMMQQQQSAMQTQNLLQNQLQSTQTALQNQQRMSANLATAYVPQAEASAQSVAYGDARSTRRRQADNSLSDLSIVSGVGSNNALAGLQLAG